MVRSALRVPLPVSSMEGSPGKYPVEEAHHRTQPHLAGILVGPVPGVLGVPGFVDCRETPQQSSSVAGVVANRRRLEDSVCEDTHTEGEDEWQRFQYQQRDGYPGLHLVRSFGLAFRCVGCRTCVPATIVL
jgi:hypothetical protein